MAGERLLIVEDEQITLAALCEFFRARGFVVEKAEGCATAEAIIRKSAPDAVIADYSLSDGTGLDLVRRLRAVCPHTPAVILTGYGTIDLAVQAIKEGAEQFLTKPVQLPALQIVVERMLEQARTRRQGVARSRSEQRQRLDVFKGSSRAIRQLEDATRRLLASESPVLIQGETGSGKGVLARWIHQHGPRASEPLVDVNCAGFSKELLESELFGHEKGAFTGAVMSKQGLLEIAHRGTVFLDEVGDMDPAIQPKFLLVLEEKRYRRVGDVQDRRIDVRVITATHHDLEAMVAEGRFRADLYYRIGTLPLVVPPLRERVEDIAMLAADFVAQIAADMGRPPLEIARDAVALLEGYAWPGNIRELRNAVERAVLMADGSVIAARHFEFLGRSSRRGASDDVAIAIPPSSRSLLAAGAPPSERGPATLLDLERAHIERVLDEEEGRVEAAARRLGVPRSSLYTKIKKYGIKYRN